MIRLLSKHWSPILFFPPTKSTILFKKVKFSPELATKAQRCRSIYSFFSLGDRFGGERHAPVANPRERPCTQCIGGWVGFRAGLDGCGKSCPPTGIRSPYLPACSESLYRLSYTGRHNVNCMSVLKSYLRRVSEQVYLLRGE